MKDDERRQAPRIRKSFMVKYRCPAVGVKQWLMSPLRDLSATGIRFVSDYAFPAESVLELQLCLPSSAKPLALPGVVKWAKPAGALGALTEHGVTFGACDAPTQDQIMQAVQFFLDKERQA